MDNVIIFSLLAGAAILGMVLYFLRKKKKKVISQNLVLYQFNKFYNTSSMSPFCTKLETWLKINGLFYENNTKLLSGPKGKLPYVEIDGKEIGDSSMVIEYLTNKYDLIDKHYDEAQLISAYPLKVMFEEFYYWVIVEQRWKRDEVWDKYIVDSYFVTIPKFIRRFMANNFIRPQVLKYLHGQGLGRHSPEEVERIGIACLKAAVNFINEKNYVLGPYPSTVDATVFAFLTHTTDVPFDSVYKAFILSQPNLIMYINRMKAQYWATI